MTVTDAMLKDAYRFLRLRVSFEYATKSPALLTCLKNVAEIRAKRQGSHKAYTDIKTRAANPNDH